MANIKEILSFIDSELNPKSFTDHCLNGLQVEGKSEIKKIAVAVDCGLSIIEQAVLKKADILLTHHALIWNDEIRPISGTYRDSLNLLLKEEINLICQHLPLDGNLKYGNNACLAKLLELEEIVHAAPYKGSFTGVIGENKKGLTLEQIAKKLHSLHGSIKNFVELKFGKDIPKRICLLSGAGADQLYNYELENFDTLITGEPRQFAYHFCKEKKINAFFPGHYATETLGVIALGKEIATRFEIEFEFIDEKTGI
jgi:dinuclear metal center YbgI/SA1388 family protein